MRSIKEGKGLESSMKKSVGWRWGKRLGNQGDKAEENATKILVTVESGLWHDTFAHFH